MAYDIVAPIIFSCVFGLAGIVFLIWGLFKPPATSAGKVRYVAFVAACLICCVTQSVVSVRQGVSDEAGTLGKRAAYGLRIGEALALGAASTTITLSIYADMGTRILIPLMSSAVGGALIAGAINLNVGFNMWFWGMWAFILIALLIVAIWFIDHADWVAGIILRDGERLPKWNGWPWRIVHSVAPWFFLGFWFGDFDTLAGYSDTTTFILHACMQAALLIAAGLNYFLAKAVDLAEYSPVDQATNAKIGANMGGSKSGSRMPLL